MILYVKFILFQIGFLFFYKLKSFFLKLFDLLSLKVLGFELTDFFVDLCDLNLNFLLLCFVFFFETLVNWDLFLFYVEVFDPQTDVWVDFLEIL